MIRGFFHLQPAKRLYDVPLLIPSKRIFSSVTTESIWGGMSKSTRDLAQSITGGNGPIQRRVALSRAITLMESKNFEHKKQADKLLTYLLAKQPKDQMPSLRVGFAGPPGAGKSTIIETFGLHLLEKDPNLHLAVVCIDPASEISGGSILGDKTRMTELSRHDRAYIRPSSNAGVLGGLAAYTDDVVTTLSAAGYPLIFVETVGVGQSAVAHQSVDILALIINGGGGDELQGVKKGIVELANIVAVTKADGHLLEAAKKTASDYRSALNVLQISGSNTENTFKPSVILTSSVSKDGLDELWQSIQDYKAFLLENDRWEKKRQKQSKYWMWKQFTRMMQDYMISNPELGEIAKHLESELLRGNLTPRVAAQELLQGVFGTLKHNR